MESSLLAKTSELLNGHSLITTFFNTSRAKTGLINDSMNFPFKCIVGNNDHMYHVLDLTNLTDDCGEWCMNNLPKSNLSHRSVTTNIFNVCGFDVCQVVQDMEISGGPEPYVFNCHGPGGYSRTHIDNYKSKYFEGNLIIVFNSRFTGGEIQLSDHTVRFEEELIDPKVIAKAVFIPVNCKHKILQVKSGYRFSVVYSIYKYADSFFTFDPFSYLSNTTEKEFKNVVAESTNMFKKWIKGKENVYINKWMLDEIKLLKKTIELSAISKVIKIKKKNICYKVNRDIENFDTNKKLCVCDFCNFNEPIKIEWNLTPKEFRDISNKYKSLPYGVLPEENLKYEYGCLIRLRYKKI